MKIVCIPEFTGAKDRLLLAFRRRYRMKRIPMAITVTAPPTTPPIVPPMILILELEDVNAEAGGVPVAVGRSRDEKDPTVKIEVLEYEDTGPERIPVTFDVGIPTDECDLVERLVDGTREVFVDCAKEGLGIGE